MKRATLLAVFRHIFARGYERGSGGSAVEDIRTESRGNNDCAEFAGYARKEIPPCRIGSNSLGAMSHACVGMPGKRRLP
jgi:hypothetical protein